MLKSVSISLFLFVIAFVSVSAKSLYSVEDVKAMRSAAQTPSLYKAKIDQSFALIDKAIEEAIIVPVPKDGGGGYTHEQHKRNYKLIYQAALLYLIAEDRKYADYVKEFLLAYAELYPKIDLHPYAKSNSPGRLFWQLLNETVWLTHVAQAYSAVKKAIPLNERNKIEKNLFSPMVAFIKEDSKRTFNRIHNHGTWAVTAVGLTAIAMEQNDWLEQSLYGSNKDGKSGYIIQLNKLFSPDGYYSEGPYYQRYALKPFLVFARALDKVRPQLKVFELRDQVLLKAVDASLQMSYEGRVLPLNDAIVSKTIKTNELVLGVALAFEKTQDKQLLAVARFQEDLDIGPEGARMALAMVANKALPESVSYRFKTLLFSDGEDGNAGGLAILRHSDNEKSNAFGGQALIGKMTAQGGGHGHFDKLNWLFYDNGHEIISDYGAARYLNVVAKQGGRYLPENKTWAKQTVAHNTLVVDERSHFNGKLKAAEKSAPEILSFIDQENMKLISARMENAYKGVTFTRTLALVRSEYFANPFVIDVLHVKADAEHQYDLPIYYQGQLIERNFDVSFFKDSLSVLGDNNGYQHLWLKGKAKPKVPLAKLTWMTGNRFYTLNTLIIDDMQILFTELGANDPEYNLRSQAGLMLRMPKAREMTFVSVLESHGEFNPISETVRDPASSIAAIDLSQRDGHQLITVKSKANQEVVFVAASQAGQEQLVLNGKTYKLNSGYKLIQL